MMNDDQRMSSVAAPSCPFGTRVKSFGVSCLRRAVDARWVTLCVLALGSSACSLVLDGKRHHQDGAVADSSVEGGAMDGGVDAHDALDADAGGGDTGDAGTGVGTPCATEGAITCDGPVDPIRCEGGVWVEAESCDTGERCDTRPDNEGACEPIVPECADALPGEAACRGVERFTCGPDLVSREELELCAGGCVGGACTACQPEARRCRGQLPEFCEATGEWSEGAPCEYLCEAGECVGECLPDTQRCRPGAPLTPQRCDASGRWQDQPLCATACNDGDCGACTTGARRCNGQTQQTCSAAGMWGDDASCAMMSMTCRTTTGECGGVCAVGEVQCTPDNRQQTCTGHGDWGSGVLLVGACTAECTPGARRCVGNSTQTCGANARWGAQVSCGGTTPTCDPGTGACVVCLAGATRCVSGNLRQTCTASQQWGAGSLIVGQCGAVCTPGSRRCTGNSTQTCGSDGTWGASTTSCTSTNRTCIVATGQCGGVCVAGATRCSGSSGTTLQTCSTTGAWATTQSCVDSCRTSSSGFSECHAGCATFNRPFTWRYQSSGGGCWSNGDICGGTHRAPSTGCAFGAHTYNINRVAIHIDLIRGDGGSCKNTNEIIGRFEQCTSPSFGCTTLREVRATEFYNRAPLTLYAQPGRFYRFFRTATGRTSLTGHCEFGYRINRVCPGCPLEVP